MFKRQLNWLTEKCCKCEPDVGSTLNGFDLVFMKKFQSPSANEMDFICKLQKLQKFFDVSQSAFPTEVQSITMLCLRLPTPDFFRLALVLAGFIFLHHSTAASRLWPNSTRTSGCFWFFFLEQVVHTAMEDKVVNGKIKISIIPALEATRVLGETGKKNQAKLQLSFPFKQRRLSCNPHK